MADDNDLITEISWVIAISFDSIHIHLALGYNAEESFPWIKNFVYEATKKQESLLYYIRYEPADETRKSLLAADPKYKYINKIIAVNLREDHFDPIVAFDPSENEKAKIIGALLEAAQDTYADYLKESITDETKLKYLLTNRHQLLYLSMGGVLSEFRDQGLYKWFRSLIMEHIQQCYHYKRAYGSSFSAATRHIHQKDGYKVVGTIKCKTYEYPDKSENYPFKDMDDQDEISIIEKIFINE